MNIKKIGQLSIVLLGSYIVSGCPSPAASSASNQVLATSDPSAQEVVIQEVVDGDRVANGQTAAVDFEICAAVDDWQRPDANSQAKYLSESTRYSESIASGSLKTASNQFWDQQVVSFTTYGLSARIEPESFTGVWTAVAEMADCYAPELTMAINEGDRAETWLLNHRVSDLQWNGDRYVMTVEPAAAGLQVIQFDRLDSVASLPLEVVTTTGNPVEVMSGDWQE